MEDSGAVFLLDRPVYNYFHRPDSVTTSSVSDKTFHFAYQTELLYPFIREHYPEIEPQARYFRVRSLTFSLQSILLADNETRKKYAQQYRKYKAELGKHTAFILASTYFTVKERLINLLLMCGCYLPVFRLLQWVKNFRK